MLSQILTHHMSFNDSFTFVFQGDKRLVLEGVVQHFVLLDKKAKALQSKDGYVITCGEMGTL